MTDERRTSVKKVEGDVGREGDEEDDALRERERPAAAAAAAQVRHRAPQLVASEEKLYRNEIFALLCSMKGLDVSPWEENPPEPFTSNRSTQ
ncbi:hypothetical protein Nepgr_013282 [Nepenthes gracilis]|uniref:Uncharacterized protein n=1 Tax=Nepenthes gracilis TaxID=150966 RepID=A0AAD3SJ77_NEPGR|nr:hypothetical protein Nepgr_013282 [Nepenthes gracilis]